jgi:hypothetical protein
LSHVNNIFDWLNATPIHSPLRSVISAPPQISNFVLIFLKRIASTPPWMTYTISVEWLSSPPPPLCFVFFQATSVERLSSPPSPLCFLPLYLPAAQQKTLHKTPQKTLNLHRKLPIFNCNINQSKNRSKPIIKLTSIKRFGEKLKQNKHNLLISTKSKPE